MVEQRYYTVRQATKFLGWSRSKLYYLLDDMIKSGVKLIRSNNTGNIQFDKFDLIAYMEGKKEGI